MPDDKQVRPKIVRTNSVFPASSLFPTYGDTDELFIPNPSGGRASRNWQDLVPAGYEIVERRGNGIVVRPKYGPNRPRPTEVSPDFIGPTAADVERGRVLGPSTGISEQYAQRIANRRSPITGAGVSLDGQVITGDGASSAQQDRQGKLTDAGSSLISPLSLGSIKGTEQFVFNYGLVQTPNADGTEFSPRGVLESRGVYGSADSLERRNGHLSGPANNVTTGRQQNMMTISTASLWLRRLAAKDRTAYNDIVVKLRNAGYLGSTSDEELPLNGWTTTVASAWAKAALDVSGANAGGDDRDIITYLNDRGTAYADYLKQQQADNAYQPVDRSMADPAELEAQAKQAAIAALGRKLTDAEEAKFVAAFHAKQNAMYDQIDAAGRSGSAATVTNPSIEGQAAAFVDSDEYLGEHQANLVGGYAQSFMRLMGLG